MNKLQVLPEEHMELKVLERIVKVGEPVIAPKHITENGEYSAKAEGVTGFDPVTVEVDMQPAVEAGYQKGYNDANEALDEEALLQEGLMQQISMALDGKTGMSGYDQGYDTGKQAEYDAFWDAYLDNGNLKYTLSIFSGRGWNDITFKPKHSLHNATDAYMMFRQSQITDIGKSLKECGVTFTLTGNILQYTFNGIASKTLDNIIFAKPITTMYTAFGSATNLESIECPIPVKDASISGDSFSWCVALKEIRFNGTIASNLSFPQSANLSTDSINSIIGALKDRTGTTAFTLTFHKDVGNKLTQAQKDAISAKNWTLVY